MIPWAVFKVYNKVRLEILMLSAAEMMTSPPDSVTLIIAAASIRFESDVMAKNIAKVKGTIFAGFIILCWVLMTIKQN